MKIFVTVLALFVGTQLFSQANIKFDKEKHSFGKIKQGVPASVVFTYTNTGAKPLIVETATAECGCTSPEWTKAAVAKGKSGTIKATFNAAAAGAFTKRVTVKFANNPVPVILTIEGEVIGK